jgi:hypothetical protein
MNMLGGLTGSNTSSLGGFYHQFWTFRVYNQRPVVTGGSKLPLKSVIWLQNFYINISKTQCYIKKTKLPYSNSSKFRDQGWNSHKQNLLACQMHHRRINWQPEQIEVLGKSLPQYLCYKFYRYYSNFTSATAVSSQPHVLWYDFQYSCDE